MIHEALEIPLEMEGLNREDGLRLSTVWLPAMDLIGYKSTV